jgi:hypothetical protein
MTTHSITVLSNLTATRLTPNGVHSGLDITIQNVDTTAYVYLGGEGVSASSYGYRLSPAAAWATELPGRDALYAISDTNGSSIAIIKTGLETGS